MKIHCLGLSHHTASVSLRERMALSPQAAAALIRSETASGNAISEAVLLSTCNRVEIYIVADQPSFAALESWLAQQCGLPIEAFAPACYRLLDEDALAHLLRVAAGLDSAVLGEPQILGQITEAYASARAQGTAGQVLSRLFQTAIHAGKRVRTETAISQNPASISSVAVALIAKTVPNLPAAEIIVLGAGEMAELAVEALRKRGAHRITVINRTLTRAQELAGRWQGKAAAFDALPGLLPDADVVIASTGAPHAILSAALIEQAMQARRRRPLVLMDIAIPRDVDPKAGQLPDVQLFDLDSLSAQLESSRARRAAEIPAVEAILAEEQAAFMEYLAMLDVLPIIAGLRQQADAIREAELDKTLRRLSDLSPETRQQLDLLTRSIVNKLLHTPTLRLRETAATPHAADYANLTRTLFGLD